MCLPHYKTNAVLICTVCQELEYSFSYGSIFQCHIVKCEDRDFKTIVGFIA